jgi:cullin 1
VHKKYGDVVNGPFRAELGFNASLDRVSGNTNETQHRADTQACGNFCNKNAAATTATRSPELLASYCDMLLKKSNKDFDAESLEEALNQVVGRARACKYCAYRQMVIFKFIDDKDVFQKFYQKKLSNRLINQLSASDDSESSMITKLKEVSGYDYTNKLTRMFTDVNLSRDLTEKFKERDRSSVNGPLDGESVRSI